MRPSGGTVSGKALAAAVAELFDAFGCPANICGVTEQFSVRNAEDLIRFAAKMARKIKDADGLTLKDYAAANDALRQMVNGLNDEVYDLTREVIRLRKALELKAEAR